MKLSDFDFEVPQRLIAQRPLPARDESRLMVVRRGTRSYEHRLFRDLPDILPPGFFLVLNNTRVFPARLRAHRPGKAESIEILLVKEQRPGRWDTLVKPARKAGLGQRLEMGDLRAIVVEVSGEGRSVLEFEGSPDVVAVAEKIGEPPLPPYIRRKEGESLAEDRLRYQTVYATRTGSIAAPTAGLHFTPAVLERLDAIGIERCEILLHVGYGTFQPVRAENIEDHRMEPEYFEVSRDTAVRIRNLRAAGLRVVAVGTTTTRVLEHLGRSGSFPSEQVSGMCDLFIYPGFQFRMTDALVTNFHLPRSSPFLLVCAFAGKDLMLECYRAACEREYRFFSYGDAMLVL
ncbi:MAG: tRNA preQ1(34) S-adenosylmethionine ribosyltransferase-isomerase QueA [Acidobacteria bacterium]|nr:tRNA preQ1(34) S-adenosylmethionine ribosyltransferase-isomerase QueA [Acidobacteriota bacterium]